MRPLGAWKKFPPIPEHPDLLVAGPLSWWLTHLIMSNTGMAYGEAQIQSAETSLLAILAAIQPMERRIIPRQSD